MKYDKSFLEIPENICIQILDDEQLKNAVITNTVLAYNIARKDNKIFSIINHVKLIFVEYISTEVECPHPYKTLLFWAVGFVDWKSVTEKTGIFKGVLESLNSWLTVNRWKGYKNVRNDE